MSAVQRLEELDKNSMVPLYRQLAQSVEKKIQDGSFPEGSRIPSEQEWMRRFSLSRVTVRQAMEDLFQRNIIVRKQGLGTFVQKSIMAQDVDDLFGFYPTLVSRGLNPKTRLFGYEFINSDPNVQEKLGLAPGEKVLRFCRQYLLEPSLFLVIQMHIPRALAENWTEKDAVEKNSFCLLQEKAGVRIQSSALSIRASLASAKVSEWLKIPKGSPVLELQRLTYSTGKRPVEYAVLFFPGESYELRTLISAGGKSALKVGRH
jgi:GntR family transcriptional regulator